MTDKSKYDPLKRLSKESFKPVNITNARKHVKRKKKIYYKKKGKNKARR
jgi:hypothetical protein